jgi:hypothetical protein
LIYFRVIQNILWIFGIFYDHLVHFVFVWFIFSSFGIMYPEKSGNPGCDFNNFLQRELGSMLWSPFSAKKLQFFSKTNLLIIVCPNKQILCSENFGDFDFLLQTCDLLKMIK